MLCAGVICDGQAASSVAARVFFRISHSLSRHNLVPDIRRHTLSHLVKREHPGHLLLEITCKISCENPRNHPKEVVGTSTSLLVADIELASSGAVAIRASPAHRVITPTRFMIPVLFHVGSRFYGGCAYTRWATRGCSTDCPLGDINIRTAAGSSDALGGIYGQLPCAACVSRHPGCNRDLLGLARAPGRDLASTALSSSAVLSQFPLMTRL